MDLVGINAMSQRDSVGRQISFGVLEFPAPAFALCVFRRGRTPLGISLGSALPEGTIPPLPSKRYKNPKFPSPYNPRPISWLYFNRDII
jgi:hypothetical protein